MTQRPSEMDRTTFVDTFGGIFEHSPWIAEAAFDSKLGPAHDTAKGLHQAFTQAFRAAPEEKRLKVLRAHPDLAVKISNAAPLTVASSAEQASAGLDALNDFERGAFMALNEAYVTEFGFPFIVAVRDHTKMSIMEAFHNRLQNDREMEFAEACRQVERIAELRLAAHFDA